MIVWVWSSRLCLLSVRRYISAVVFTYLASCSLSGMWSGESRRVFILDRVKIIKVFFFRTVLRCLQASAAVWELSRSSVMWILCESDTTVSGKERVQEQFCALVHCRERNSAVLMMWRLSFSYNLFLLHTKSAYDAVEHRTWEKDVWSSWDFFSTPHLPVTVDL